MSVGVFTPELRFKWVKGQVTSGEPDEGFVACGDGTAFPMEVTLDQLAEIYYRVKDARCTQGRMDFRITFASGYPPRGGALEFTSHTPGALVETENTSWNEFITYSQRGFCTTRNDDSDPMPDYGNEYFTLPSAKFSFSTWEYIGGDYGEEEYEETVHTISARYASTSEYVLFAQSLGRIGHYEIVNELGDWLHFTPVSQSNQAVKTGFSYRGSSTGEVYGIASQPGIYAPFNYSYEPSGPLDSPTITEHQKRAEVILEFGPRVAYTGESPLDHESHLFIDMTLLLITDTLVPLINQHIIGSTHKGYYWISGSSVDTGTVLKLKLSGNDNYVSAKIYSRYFTHANGDTSGFYEGVDWVFEATEWWPYAKDSPAVPVWNADTGERL